MTADRNCISYWLPVLERAALPTPKTIIVRYPHDGNELFSILDGQIPPGWAEFTAELQSAGGAIGYPLFMRTGQTSGKHDWKDCCYVASADDIVNHVARLVDRSACAGFFGLPVDVWAIRRMLPVKPICTLPYYGDMPLVREVRAFVRDGKEVCRHCYWPAESIEHGFGYYAGDGEPMAKFIDRVLLGRYKREAARLPEGDEARALAELIDRVAKAFAGDGAWSVDFLETTDGWCCIDMAEAANSFHLDGCPHKVSFGGHS
jgi:hypothetical protein